MKNNIIRYAVIILLIIGFNLIIYSFSYDGVDEIITVAEKHQSVEDGFGFSVEKADNNGRYKVKIVNEKHQSVEDGLKFSVEIENELAEQLHLRITEKTPPFRFDIINPYNELNLGLYASENWVEWGDISGNNRRIIVDANSKTQLGTIIFKSYFGEDNLEKNITQGRYVIKVYFSEIDDSKGENNLRYLFVEVKDAEVFME